MKSITDRDPKNFGEWLGKYWASTAEYKDVFEERSSNKFDAAQSPKGKGYRRAFTIIEVSIVLIIIGTITVNMLGASNTQIETTKYRQTWQKFKIIHDAIEAFVLVNNRLPCPADATLGITTATAGDEFCAGTVSATASWLAVMVPDDVALGGSIPFSALMLPKDVAIDGWGNKITYVVSRGLTTSPNGFDSQSYGTLKVQKYGGAISNGVASYLFISHGASGKGSWRVSGVRTEAGTLDKKYINSHTPASPSPTWDDVFRQNFSYKLYYTPSNWPASDDIVDYRTKDHILFNLGYTYSGSGCADAYTAVAANDNPATKLCNGTGGSAQGTASHPYCNEYILTLANEVKKRCIPRIQ